MEKVKNNLPELLVALLISIVIALASNKIGYKFGILESIPGLLILAVISLIGYILSWLIPVKKLSAVLWISILAISLASPISPVSDKLIESVSKVNLMSVVTPILAYAGVIVGKDWASFRKVGIKGVIVSIFVIAGTFLISALMGDFFMSIF